MTGELLSQCSGCGGSGFQTRPKTQASISATTQALSEHVPCPKCNGTGKALGVPGTVEDITAYANLALTVGDQIFDLAKRLQTQRNEDIRLKSWTDRTWGNDDPFQYVSTTGYQAILTKSAEFTVLTDFVQNYEHKTNGANRFVAESRDWAPIDLASLDDITVLFDFAIYGHYSNPGWAEYEGHFEFPGLSGAAFHADWHKGYKLSVTRLYQKGYGLLTLLQSLLAA